MLQVCRGMELIGRRSSFNWPGRRQQRQFKHKELIPIIMAAAMWGSLCRGQIVNCHSYNMAVVAVTFEGRMTFWLMVQTAFFLAGEFELSNGANSRPVV